MTSSGHDIPASQAILDAQDRARNFVNSANRAIIDAIRAALDFDAMIAPNLFGADMGTLKCLATMPRQKAQLLLMTGVPVFGIRIARPDFAGRFEDNEGADSILRALLNSFEEPVAIRSLGPVNGSEIPASQAILDAQDQTRRLVEVANRAVLDAMRATLDVNDPIAPNLFGTDPTTLKRLASIPRSKFQLLLMTGVPLYSVRFDDTESEDVVLRTLLTTFGKPATIQPLS